MVAWRRPSQTTADARAYYDTLLRGYVELGVLWQAHACRAGVVWLAPEDSARLADKRRTERREAAPEHATGAAPRSELWDWLDARLPSEPVWFLELIAVAPEAQGQGWGGALVEHGLDRARAARCPAFLETSRASNVPFYESHGFRVVDHGLPPGDGPPVWFMQA
jgi:ribosomal protein S18 acetylase RimI-like enzyme